MGSSSRAVDEFVGVEEKDSEVGEGSGVWVSVGGLRVFLVVVEDGEFFLVFEGLTAEFFDEGTGDLGRVSAGFGRFSGVVFPHFENVLLKVLGFELAGLTVEDEKEGSFDLGGKRGGFFFETKSEGDGTIRDEVAI